MTRAESDSRTHYLQVSQSVVEEDPPPNYEGPPEFVQAQDGGERGAKNRNSITINMPTGFESLCRGHMVCKIVSTVMVVVVSIIIACTIDSYHKIHEGYVGIYFKHGALRDRVTEPGVHFLFPFLEDYKEVKIRPETIHLEPVLAITKDGIENTFREITVITTITKEKLIFMIKKYGMEFKRTLVVDRIKEDLRIFCANHTIDEVYNSMFLDIVENVKVNVKSSIKRLGDEGIQILNLVIPKPEIPSDIAHNYKQVKVQWTEQLVATQQQKTEKIKKETEEMKAIADAERQKAVLEITIEERILEKRGEEEVSTINNIIKMKAENNQADIEKYKLESEAAANNKLYTKEYIQLNLAKSLANNTKYYFSGQQSEMGAIFNRILGV